MPQLSPMSWILVFGGFLVFWLLISVGIWWGTSGKYFSGFCGDESVDMKKGSEKSYVWGW
uniref:ATP synthase F0 subunit 8 n=1 Tax=Neotrigonia margaritacea TaxID=47539 RepID=A0A1Y9T605_9BIVA|nr:ATP synthase F0 subunit 8 [Neotrigonia margaritacea]AQT38496.1 ATP synthase F0 subunit 8 [Neotrigonia margaritacea]